MSRTGRHSVLRQVPAVVAAATAAPATRPAGAKEPPGLAQAHAPGGHNGLLDLGVGVSVAAVILVAVADVIAVTVEAVAALMVEDIPPGVLLDGHGTHFQALHRQIPRPGTRRHHALSL